MYLWWVLFIASRLVKRNHAGVCKWYTIYRGILILYAVHDVQLESISCRTHALLVCTIDRELTTHLSFESDSFRYRQSVVFACTVTYPQHLLCQHLQAYLQYHAKELLLRQPRPIARSRQISLQTVSCVHVCVVNISSTHAMPIPPSIFASYLGFWFKSGWFKSSRVDNRSKPVNWYFESSRYGVLLCMDCCGIRIVVTARWRCEDQVYSIL